MKYQIGDKVKRISSIGKGAKSIEIGMKGEIERISDGTTYPYDIKWENGTSIPMDEGEIELIKPKPKISKKKLEEKKKLIIKEIKNNPAFLRQFTNVEKEVNSWSEEAIVNWK